MKLENKYVSNKHLCTSSLYVLVVALGEVPDSADGQFCSSCFKRTFCLGGTEEIEEEEALAETAAAAVATLLVATVAATGALGVVTLGPAPALAGAAAAGLGFGFGIGNDRDSDGNNEPWEGCIGGRGCGTVAGLVAVAVGVTAGGGDGVGRIPGVVAVEKVTGMTAAFGRTTIEPVALATPPAEVVVATVIRCCSTPTG